MHSFFALLLRSVLLTAGCVLVGVVWNAVRPGGIPLVAPRPYDIYVPCPETEVEADSISAEDVVSQANVVYVDARPREEFDRLHIKGAVSFPYPLLDEPVDEQAAALKRRRVPIVTYGNGGRGDLGDMLASLLTELEIPNVSHLEGGLPAWRERGGAVEGPGTSESQDAGAAPSVEGDAAGGEEGEASPAADAAAAGSEEGGAP